MTTFSQMVDEIISEVRRPDLTSDVTRYLNQTIREVHFDPTQGVAVFYRDNLRESQILTTAEGRHIWEIPRPANFQQIVAVNYPTIYKDDNTVWLQETSPGRHLRDMLYFYYRVGQTFVFSGTGNIGTPINLAWYEFPCSLPYFRPDCRPMEFDSLGGKIYSSDWKHPEDYSDADSLSTNWLLTRWGAVISEGVRAKVYKRLSDTERARTSYSLYSQLRKGLATSELALLI